VRQCERSAGEMRAIYLQITELKGRHVPSPHLAVALFLGGLQRPSRGRCTPALHATPRKPDASLSCPASCVSDVQWCQRVLLLPIVNCRLSRPTPCPQANITLPDANGTDGLGARKLLQGGLAVAGCAR